MFSAVREPKGSGSMSLSPDLKKQILLAAQQQPAPARTTRDPRALALVASAVLVPLAMFVAAGGARSGPRPLALVVGTGLGALAIAAVALWSALGRGGSMLGRSRSWLLAVAVAAPLGFLAWKLAWTSRFENMAEPWATRPGYRCLLLTFAIGLWPLLAVVGLRRDSDPTHPRSLGLAFGVAAGSAAAALVDLWCPVGHLQHLLTGHVMPMAVLGACGVVLGQRWLAVRAQR